MKSTFSVQRAFICKHAKIFLKHFSWTRIIRQPLALTLLTAISRIRRHDNLTALMQLPFRQHSIYSKTLLKRRDPPEPGVIGLPFSQAFHRDHFNPVPSYETELKDEGSRSSFTAVNELCRNTAWEAILLSVLHFECMHVCIYVHGQLAINGSIWDVKQV